MKTIQQFANDRGIDEQSFLEIVQGISPGVSLSDSVNVGVISKAWATWTESNSPAPETMQHQISTSRGGKTMSMDIDSTEFEQKVKAEWNGNEQIRDEFARFSTYLAFRKAEASGKVKLLGGGVVNGARHVQA